jgi:hypothetical protein
MLTLNEITAACGTLEGEGYRRISAYLYRLWINHDHIYVMFIIGHIEQSVRSKIDTALEKVNNPADMQPQLQLRELATATA